ncbi:hypothetical protein PIB30_016352 [Stylosanthes scabra]|uniref:Uncharacterized protein n=1 Tax=Stylosanthes scabra TaxID=79078 RepID=A0ABU6T6Z5_9FABA|nr:hypothetical protein [Stylosanthes scabra]
MEDALRAIWGRPERFKVVDRREHSLAKNDAKRRSVKLKNLACKRTGKLAAVRGIKRGRNGKENSYPCKEVCLDDDQLNVTEVEGTGRQSCPKRYESPILKLSGSLLDLGMAGRTFTWSYRRFGVKLTQERLDCVLTTADWCSIYPSVALFRLQENGLDHARILLDYNPPIERSNVDSSSKNAGVGMMM